MSFEQKYIAIRVTHVDKREEEYILTFPPIFNHDEYAMTVRRLRDRKDYHQQQRVEFEVVGAGFTDHKQCWGRSETLNKDSRGETDAKLLKKYD